MTTTKRSNFNTSQQQRLLFYLTQYRFVKCLLTIKMYNFGTKFTHIATLPPRYFITHSTVANIA